MVPPDRNTVDNAEWKIKVELFETTSDLAVEKRYISFSLHGQFVYCESGLLMTHDLFFPSYRPSFRAILSVAFLL